MALAENSNIDFDALYSAFQKAETGGQENPFIRTQVSSAQNQGKASSAFGPVQMTYSTVQDIYNRYKEDMPEELQQFAQNYIQQGKNFINVGGDTKDPIYGLGGTGNIIQSERDKELYKELSKYVMGGKIQDIKARGGNANIEDIIQSWRGVSREQDPRYYDTVMGALGQTPQMQTDKNPQVAQADLVKEAFNQTMPVASGAFKTTEESTRVPSLSAYLKYSQGPQDAPASTYSELVGGDSKLSNAIDPNGLMQAKFRNLVGKQPKERAEIGKAFGSAIGLSTGGLVGSLIGAGVGSMATRAIGQLQSGEHQAALNRRAVSNVFKYAKITGEDNTIKFDDGTSFTLNDAPDFRLPNMSSSISGKQDRAVYEVDTSHPFTNRTLKAVTPLAYIINSGLLGKRNFNDKSSKVSLEQTVAMLTNAVQKDAKDINTVYKRTKEVATKLGLDKEKLAMFIKDIGNKLDTNTNQKLKAGMEALYG